MFDIPTSVLSVNREPRLSPFIQAVVNSIQDRGYRVLGMIGREKTFSQSSDNWKRVINNGSVEVVDDATIVDQLREAPAIYLGCHFLPPGLKQAEFDEPTKMAGMVNNFLDLPGVNFRLLDGLHSPYAHAVVMGSNRQRELERLGIACMERSELTDRLRSGAKLVVKDIGRMSIGGAGVEIVDQTRADDYLNVKAAVVTPFVEFPLVETGEGPRLLQTRILYSPKGPELVAAKLLPPGEQNSSGFADTAAVFDFEQVYLLKTPQRGVLKIVPTVDAELVRHFEQAVEQGMPLVNEVERRLQQLAEPETMQKHFKECKRAGLVPGSAMAYLNPFVR